MSFHWPPSGYLIALAVSILTTLIARPLRDWIDLANIVMIFLLSVLVIALKLGRGPAVMTAFLSVGLFDFFFVPPHLTLSVADAQYLITFAVMLAVGLITSHLVAAVAERTQAAQARERETRTLYELARDLGATLTVEQVTATLEAFVDKLGFRYALLIASADLEATPFVAYGSLRPSALQIDAASAAYRDDAVVESDGPDGSRSVYLPLAGTTRLRGVLAVAPLAAATSPAAQRPLFEAVASLTGIAVERIHYAEIAQQSELDVQTEKLRSSILSSISHDLRTPLTSLVGQADALKGEARLPAEFRETASIIRDQARAMHSMVSNLLELARLRSGRVVLNRQWQPIEEIVGSSVRLLGDVLARRNLVIALGDDLPLVEFDAVLIERVVCNLLENAGKYSPAGASIRIEAKVEPPHLEVTVCNAGSRFPADRVAQVFEAFVRGDQEPVVAGTGIGLSVCRAIVIAHGGFITAENCDDGACVRFGLPLGTPPALEGELA